MLTRDMMHKERKRVPRAPVMDIAALRSPDEEAPTEPAVPHADLALKYTIEINTATVIADDVMGTNPEVDFESIADKDAWYSIKRFVYGEIKDELADILRQAEGITIDRAIRFQSDLDKRRQDHQLYLSLLDRMRQLILKL